MSAVVVCIFDIVIINCAILLAMLVTHNFSLAEISRNMVYNWLKLMPFFSILTVAIMELFRGYRMIWTLVGMREMLRVIPAIILSCIGGYGVNLLLHCNIKMGEWFLILVFMLVGMCGMRCSYRILQSVPEHYSQYPGHRKKTINVMVVGAGKAGQTIVKELRTVDRLRRTVCCIVDDNSQKVGKYLEDVPIVGDTLTIPYYVQKYNIQEIVFAIPSAQPRRRRDILDICNRTGCQLRALPGIYQMIDGEVSLKALRDVSVEDLLDRDMVCVDNEDILEKLRGKTVLVTGGGGSIGSELCRQIAAHEPGILVIFDIYENCAYDIQQELRRKYPDLHLEVQIGSVRDIERMDTLFRTYEPNIVFHAAAHKHVPLMEDSPCEAIKNNVFGTYHTALMADRYHADTFLLISTDKAVNPTNVMGASKRLCEMVVRYMSEKSETKFVAVRFGNVLGSNGSVVPLFRRQIEEGGPVTVTDPEVIRYFMTIPEAVSLILQASALAKNGEVYVLDMGKPVRIDDMARNMIRLCGLEPDVDIQIVYTGLRPGEKLFEELLMDEEGLRRTKNNLIFIGKPMELNMAQFERDLERLRAAADTNDASIKELIAEVVPTYTGCRNT